MKLAFNPKFFEQGDFAFAVLGQQNADNVIAEKRFADVENFSISARGANDLALFAQINGGFDGGETV